MYTIEIDTNGFSYFHCPECNEQHSRLDSWDFDVYPLGPRHYCKKCGYWFGEGEEDNKGQRIEKSVLDKLADILKEVKGDG